VDILEKIFQTIKWSFGYSKNNRKYNEDYKAKRNQSFERQLSINTKEDRKDKRKTERSTLNEIIQKEIKEKNIVRNLESTATIEESSYSRSITKIEIRDWEYELIVDNDEYSSINTISIQSLIGQIEKEEASQVIKKNKEIEMNTPLLIRNDEIILYYSANSGDEIKINKRVMKTTKAINTEEEAIYVTSIAQKVNEPLIPIFAIDRNSSNKSYNQIIKIGVEVDDLTEKAILIISTKDIIDELFKSEFTELIKRKYSTINKKNSIDEQFQAL